MSKPHLYYRFTIEKWHWTDVDTVNGRQKRAYVRQPEFVLVHIPKEEKVGVLTFNRLVLELTGELPNEVFDKSVGVSRIPFKHWKHIKDHFHIMKMDDAMFLTERF